MSLPLLRETRMPAVLVEIGSRLDGGRAGTALASALAGALGAWAVRLGIESRRPSGATGS